MRLFISICLTLFCSLLVISPVEANHPVPTTGGVGTSTPVVLAVSHHFKGIVATRSSLTDAQRIQSLIKSIRSIEDRGLWGYTEIECKSHYKCEKFKDLPKPYKFKRCSRRVKRCIRRAVKIQKKRVRIAKAALAAEKVTGVDATFLIAVGRMESDFRPLYLVNSGCKSNGTCYADCGITQHHVRGPGSYVKRYCRKVAKDYNLSFLKSGKEFAHHLQYCHSRVKSRWHQPIKRCVLNRYNQGTFYLTRKRCRSRHRCHTYRVSHYPDFSNYYRSLQKCKRARRKCLSRAAYWKQLSCFHYGAIHHLKSKRSCRRCYSIQKIPKFYPPLTPATPLKPNVVSFR